MSYIGKGVETVTFNTATTLDVAGNITLGGTVDGRDVATDGTKLDTITSGAIADILQDTTPQLGGNLDLNTSNVIGTGNINVTGSITGTSFVSTGNMSFTNNSKAIFGTSPSLEIYHDGSNSILDDVGAGNFKMQLAGADKLEITSTGVSVTGTVAATAFSGDGSALTGITIPTLSSLGIANHNQVTVTAGGAVTATSFSGDGSALTGIPTPTLTSLGIANHDDITVDGSGNVGIGTSSPAAGVDVAYSGTAAAFRVYNSQATNPYGLLVDNTAADTSDSNYIADFRSGGATRLRVQNNGNVGIGVTNPTYQLQLASTDPRIAIRNDNAGTWFTSVGWAVPNSNDYSIVQAGVAERLRIDSGGRVTMPSQPSFRAEAGPLGYISTSPIPFSSVQHNVGSHYSTSTNRFTAPIAGIYALHLHIGFVRINSGSGWAQTELRRNGAQLAYSYFQGPTATAYAPASVSVLVSLNANDYVEAMFQQSNGNYYANARELQFSGYLVG